jgi:hypothetical protein
MDGSTYAVRLRDLEQRVDELKEQIRRSHTRLSLLSDTILSGGVGGARAEISFKNELSNAFHLTGATFVLDGAVQYNKQDDTGALAEQKQIPIFSGSIPPGDHTLQVVLKLRGHGYDPLHHDGRFRVHQRRHPVRRDHPSDKFRRDSLCAGALEPEHRSRHQSGYRGGPARRLARRDGH